MKAENATSNRLVYYYVSLSIFILCLVLLLFIIVDISRGFLFTSYFKIGAPSVLANFNPLQLLWLLVAGLGLWSTYKYMQSSEKYLQGTRRKLKVTVRTLAIFIGILLIVDLFIYRGIPASRYIEAGKMTLGTGPLGLGRAIPVSNFPNWLQPMGDAVSYILVVWHATLIGMLLGSLFLVSGDFIIRRMKGNSFGTHLTGAALALSQPFCSCCAAPVGSALYRKGASLGPTLAFAVSAPMLNITSLILAITLLPTEFALIRIIGGIIIGVFLTYGVSQLAARWVTQAETPDQRNETLTRVSQKFEAYNRFFHFDKLLVESTEDSVSAFISNWLHTAWRLAKIMVPLLVLGAILAAYIVKAMPDSSNTIGGVVLTSIFGSLLMVPTWTEIPLAGALINHGLTGIAATVLITLPAVSVPALLIIMGAIRSLKVALVLGFSVVIVGIITGVIFL